MVAWVLILMIVPVFTGAITAPMVTSNHLTEPIASPSTSGIVHKATMGKGDLFSTLTPDNSPLVMPLAFPVRKGVISTVEDNSNSSATEGDPAGSITQLARDGTLSTVKSEQTSIPS